MKPLLKKILIAFVVLVAIALVYGAYEWFKPARNVQKETAVTVTAPDLYKAFQANEKEPRYIDKAVQVSGAITETSTNQLGQTVCFLDTGDPMAIINCTFSNKQAVKPGAQITVKGRCTGYVGDLLPQVTLVDCKIVP